MNIKGYLKRIRYVFEYQIVKFGLWFFSCFTIETASNIASKISKFVGKKISVNQLARDNMKKAIPTLTKEELDQNIDNMWDNLGRIVGEYGHVSKFSGEELMKYCEMDKETEKNFKAMSESDSGGILFSGHLGNWEVGPKVFMANGLDVSTVYRPLNNPLVEKLTGGLRGLQMIGKSAKGSRKIVEAIRKGGYVAIMADQKVSEGEAVKFFHDDAVTTTSIARIILKYDVPLIPVRCIRVGNQPKFKLEVKKPVDFTKSGDIDLDVVNLTLMINQQLEEWIKEYPSQWFWVHNRWKR
ncbi:MAG: lysophospholipid acyltransferase family protein [Rickettsiales bacterium]|nr:lysophospholipid acyltransferase family protein [Rickettsiales bacterium]